MFANLSFRSLSFPDLTLYTAPSFGSTDAKIRTAFAEYIPEVTKLIIAQRISSVEHADRIVVLNEGRVDGFDTHENLLQNNAIYQEIYETQMHGNADFDEPQRMGGQSR